MMPLLKDWCAHGLLLMDKPVGPSSQGVLSILKRQLGLRRAGHAGTLDPLASGLLLCALGEATKFLSFLGAISKTYEVIARLGVTTETDDLEGEVLQECPEKAARLSFSSIHRALQSLVGESLQDPPRYSALKYQGKPRYLYARQGKNVPDAAPRAITIHKITEVISLSKTEVSFKVECSTGTYIRSLVRDLGKLLQVGATMVALRRTACGVFELKTALELDPFQTDPSYLLPAWHPMEALCLKMGAVQVDAIQARALGLGQSIPCLDALDSTLDPPLQKRVKVFSSASGAFLGVAEQKGGVLMPKRWLSPQASRF